MNVLFLDVDGVLNSEGFLKRGGAYWELDPVCVALLNNITDETGCKIVLSSTWRFMPDILKVLRKINGVTGEIIGKTPDLAGIGNIRGNEIQSWLRDRPEVEKFVILDDDNDMGELLPYLVQTSFETGLTQEHVKEIIRRLK